MGERKSSSFATKTIDPNYIHKRDYLSFQERKKERKKLQTSDTILEASKLRSISNRGASVSFFFLQYFLSPFPPYGEGRKKEREREER